MWPWNSTWPCATNCSHCEGPIPSSGSLLCAACLQYPKILAETEAAFCSHECEQQSKIQSSPHFRICVNFRERIILQRMARIAQEAFLAYREACYDDVVLDFIVDSREPLQHVIILCSLWDFRTNGVLIPTQFGHHDKNEQARRAILCHTQSQRALACTSVFMRIASKMLNYTILEASCMVKEDFRPITILDPRGDDCDDWLGYLVITPEEQSKWMIDLTGAQYGFPIPLVAWEFVTAFHSVYDIRQMQTKSTDTNHKMDRVFANLLGSWVGEYNETTLSALLSSGEETFERTLKDLLDNIKRDMTQWVSDHRADMIPSPSF